MKKILSVLLTLVLTLSIGTYTFAAESEGKDFNPSTVYTKFDYTILDKDGNVRENGNVDFSTRMSWSGITLRNGEQFILKPSHANSFSVSAGTQMRFKFTLDRMAMTSYCIIKHTTSGSAIWKGGSTDKVSGASIYATADYSAGYTGKIINYSSDSFKITYCEFSF